MVTGSFCPFHVTHYACTLPLPNQVAKAIVDPRYVVMEYLAKIDWNNTLKNKAATECWHILKSEIDCVVDKFVPLKKQGNGQRRNIYRRKLLKNQVQANDVEDI